MDFVACLSTLLIGYLIGSFPTGVVIGKLFYKKDPRDYGSHNSGGTNAGRVFGPVGGVIVIVGDMIKTLIPFYSFYAIVCFTPIAEAWNLFDGGVLAVWLSLFGATIGHCYSLYLKFGGGKAVSCFMAATGGVSPVGFGVCALAFASVITIKKKVVSFASLISGGIIVLYSLAMGIAAEVTGNNFSFLMFDFGYSGWLGYGYESALVAFLCYCILVFRHIPNIKRLLAGEEKPAQWKK